MDCSPSKARLVDAPAVHSQIEVKSWVSNGKSRFIIQVGCVAPPSEPGVHNNSLVNIERALLERVYFVKNSEGEFVTPPKPVDGAFDDCQLFRRNVNRHMRRIPALSLDEFPGRYKDARKRAIYRAAVATLNERALSDDDFLVKGFVKDEKLNFTIKKDPVPRAILPVSPVANVVEGSINAHREHALFEAIDKVFGMRVVMKGLNASERGRIIAEKWERFNDPVGVGADASRWDQHCSEDALAFQNSCFLDHCVNESERRVLSRCLEAVKCGSGVMVGTDGKAKFKRKGGRLSGTMHTSSGNVLLMCAMFWTYMQRFPGLKWDYINDGDDCVLFLEKGDVAEVMRGFEPWFLAKGYTMVCEDPVYDLERVEFCQSKPVWTPDGYVMCRNPHTALVKDTLCLKKPQRLADWASWVRSVGEAGISLAGGMPIFQDYYAMFIRSAGDAKVNKGFRCDGGLKLSGRGMHRKHGEVHPRTRFSFYVAFGVLPDAQVATEHMFTTMHMPYHDPELTPWAQSLPSYF